MPASDGRPQLQEMSCGECGGSAHKIMARKRAHLDFLEDFAEVQIICIGCGTETTIAPRPAAILLRPNPEHPGTLRPLKWRN